MWAAEFLEYYYWGNYMESSVRVILEGNEYWWNSNFATAIIAFLGVIGSGFLTYCINKKLNREAFIAQGKLQNSLIKEQKRIHEENQLLQESITSQNIDANIKANARIEWIQEVRRTVSSYLSILSKLRNLNLSIIKQVADIEYIDGQISVCTHSGSSHEGLDAHKKNLLAGYRRLKHDVNVIEVDVVEYSEKLLLFFSEKVDHKTIENLIMECPNNIIMMKNIFENQNRENFEAIGMTIAKNISELRQELRRYLKIEWDRAKNNE